MTPHSHLDNTNICRCSFADDSSANDSQTFQERDSSKLKASISDIARACHRQAAGQVDLKEASLHACPETYSGKSTAPQSCISNSGKASLQQLLRGIVKPCPQMRLEHTTLLLTWKHRQSLARSSSSTSNAGSKAEADLRQSPHVRSPNSGVQSHRAHASFPAQG